MHETGKARAQGGGRGEVLLERGARRSHGGERTHEVERGSVGGCVVVVAEGVVWRWGVLEELLLRVLCFGMVK